MSKRFRIICTGDSLTYATQTGGGSPLVTWFYQAMGYGASSDFFYTDGRNTVPPGNPRSAAKFTTVEGYDCMNISYPGWKPSDIAKQVNGTDGFFPMQSLINQDYLAVSGRPEIVHIAAIRIGTNQDSGVPSTTADSIRDICLTLQAIGVHVILCPVPSRTSAANDTNYTVPLNALLGAFTSSDGVAAVVSSANALVYGVDACSNLTYFISDKIHLTQAGQDIMSNDFRPVLDSLIASL